MAGLFSIIYGLLYSTSKIVNSTKEILYNENSQETALRSNNDIFYDMEGKPHWSKNGEEVIISNDNGNYVVYGKKTLTFYINKNNEIKEKQKSLFERAIDEAIKNNYKYFQWNFPCDMFNSPNCYVGYEVETNKKYFIKKSNGKFYLVYLQDNPIKISMDRKPGYKFIYEPVFYKKDNEVPYDGKKYYLSQHHQRIYHQNYSDDDRQYFYYSLKYEISEEEYEERKKMLSFELYNNSFNE